LKMGENTFCFEQELRCVNFHDERLNKRAGLVLNRMLEKSEGPTNGRAKTWTEAMATYRFFANPKVTVDDLLEGHRHSLLERAAQEDILIIPQDTTKVVYSSHVHADGLGPIANGCMGRGAKGLFVHTSMVFNQSATPLGILDQEIWVRDEKNKGDGSRKRESQRWQRAIRTCADLQAQLPRAEIYCVGDRESDADINIRLGQEHGVRVIARASEKNRVNENGEKIVASLRKLPAAEVVRLKFTDNRAARKRPKTGDNFKRNRQIRFEREAEVEVRFAPITTRQGLSAWVVVADEPHPPKDIEPVSWLLFSAFPVNSLQDARQVINVYKMRWEIEIFHRILKGGCHIEDCRLDSFEKLSKFIAASSLVAWRLHLLTKISRENPETSCESVLTLHQWQALLAISGEKLTKKPPTIHHATMMIARLGGHLNRKSDGPPGVQTMWRGWQRLIDIEKGFSAAAKLSHLDVYNR
jgi:hypothetical protein